MSIFSSIGHFFSSLFGANGDMVQKVLHDVSGLVAKAEPIVAEVEADLKTLAPTDKSGILTAIETFVVKYEPDLAKAQTAVASLSGLSSSDLFRQAAVFALGQLVPGGSAAASLLNLAVELAYNIFKAKRSSAPVPSLAPAV